MANWTSEQKRAIEAGGDLLVSAGAGSGKTAVLTERIVRLVKEGLDIRELLCVTFTNAAAGEMKKRIERALYLASANAADENEAARLNEAARMSASASISTLHSFCTQLLRRHFNEAGLDPDFRVADESEAALLREGVWDELCEARLGASDGGFASLLEALGGDWAAYSVVYELYDFCRALPDADGFLDRITQSYETDADALEASDAAQSLVARTRRRIGGAAAALASARDALAKELPNLAAFLDEEIMHARMIAMQKNPADLRAALATDAHPHPGKKISWRGCEGALKANADTARKALKTALGRERETWRKSMEEEAALLRRQAPLMRELCESVRDFARRFAQAKREKSAIDYADMEQLALALLKNGQIAQEYRARFRYVFMDEYQDCNSVQEEIIRAVANPGALFLVGDVKQSIYRFRQAEPRLFMRRAAAYLDPEKGCRIDLNANFRSSEGVIDAVNAVFSRLMSEEAAEIEYDARAMLAHGRAEPQEQQGGAPAAQFILADMLTDFSVEDEALPADESAQDEAEADGDGGETSDDAPQPRGVAQAEASLAAKRIRAMMETETLVDSKTGEVRKPRYSDFVILLRSYKGAAEDWLSTLSLEGIPAYGEIAGGFFDAIEVRVFMELLRVIDNRQQNIPLAAVLRSPVGGLSTEELIELRTAFGRDGAGNDRSCFDALALAAGEDTALGEKARGFMKRLARYQEMAGLMSVHALIGALLDDTDYSLFCRALPGGRRREANLDALLEKARLFEGTGSSGLSAFLNYAERLRSMGASGVSQSAGADVVRLMSIHASKGLEFPYVFIGGLAHRFNTEDARKRLVMDPELGAAARFNMAGIRTQSFYARAITAKNSAKSVAEEMRVLYVAMTRAREKLVLLAATSHGDRLVSRAALPQEPASVALDTSFAGWLLGCLLHASEGNALRERYGLPPLIGANPIGIALTSELCASNALVSARMGEAAFAQFKREAQAYPADGALFENAYAYCLDAELPSKVSVTGLAGHEIRLTEAPDFLLTARMTPADRGTAYHALMQRIALAPHDEKSVEAEIARLAETGLLTPAQAEAIRAREVAAFFASDVGQRLVDAAKVRRELEFNIQMQADALGLGNSPAPVLLQGVIDCCFIEDGAWTLVDYKTDSVPHGVSSFDSAKKHAHQINLYARALARLTNIPVRRRCIYLFARGEAVEMKEND